MCAGASEVGGRQALQQRHAARRVTPEGAASPRRSAARASPAMPGRPRRGTGAGPARPPRGSASRGRGTPRSGGRCGPGCRAWTTCRRATGGAAPRVRRRRAAAAARPVAWPAGPAKKVRPSCGRMIGPLQHVDPELLDRGLPCLHPLHAQTLQHAPRRRVGGIRPGMDRGQAQPRERIREHGARGLGGQATPPVLGVEGVQQLDPPGVGLDAQAAEPGHAAALREHGRPQAEPRVRRTWRRWTRSPRSRAPVARAARPRGIGRLPGGSTDARTRPRPRDPSGAAAGAPLTSEAGTLTAAAASRSRSRPAARAGTWPAARPGAAATPRARPARSRSRRRTTRGGHTAGRSSRRRPAS